MIRIQREKLTSVLAELKILLPLHWEEIALNHEEIPLDPDYEAYLASEKVNVLHLVTVRDDDLLVGYHIAFIRGHLHYKSTLHAITDIYFVEKEFRFNGTGVAMFKFVEEDLKTLGVKKIFTGCKTHADHAPLFEAMGFTQTDKMFAKLL